MGTRGRLFSVEFVVLSLQGRIAIALLSVPFQSTVYEGTGNLLLLAYLLSSMSSCKDSWTDDVPRTTCNSKNRCFRLSVMLMAWALPGGCLVWFCSGGWVVCCFFCFLLAFQFLSPSLSFFL